jgi:hypothetical protein
MHKVSINTLRRSTIIFFFAAIFLNLTACSNSNFPFNPIDPNKVYKPSSIAIISGGEQDAHVKLAGYLTQELTERSTFRVMSQKEIEKRISDYPPTITMNSKFKDDEEKPIWVPASEKAKLNAIQAKLKVDYLFVVWNRFVRRVTVTSQNGGSTTDYVYPAGNLIEYPGAKVVASTMSVAGSDLSPLALFRDADYYILDALKDASEDIADEFLDVTNSKK